MKGGRKNSTEGYNKINNWPLNFLRTGLYGRSNGAIHLRIEYGYWWSNTSTSTTHSRDFGTHLTYANSQNNDYRGDGFAVRWGDKENNDYRFSSSINSYSFSRVISSGELD